MPYYYVLWYSQNPVLESYRETYFNILKSLFQEYVSPDKYKSLCELSLEDQKKFLLASDVSSILQYFNNVQWRDVPEKMNMELWKIETELENFLKGNMEELTANKWQKIEGTAVRLTTIDNNPYNQFEAHPDHQWVWVNWGEKTEQEWLDVYKKMFDVLRDSDKDFYDELNHVIQKIIPLGTSKEVHNSASYRECFWNLYMWYTIDSSYPEYNILEAVIHESSHNKINLVMYSDPLILNDRRECYYSPYRPDARHMHGVFIGVHALVPSIHVMLKLVKKGYITDTIWKDKILLYHMKNKLWMRTLQKFWKFTELWNQIVEEIAQVSQLNDVLIREADFSDVRIPEVQKRAKQHFLEVNINYPHLQY